MSNSIIKHSFTNTVPLGSEVGVGELVICIYNETAKLYTKSLDGKIIEIGKGAHVLDDLEDVDLTLGKEGDFLVRVGNKWIATNLLGSIGNLTDVELTNVINGQYLRYDATYGSFRNFNPTYNLFEINDVICADPQDSVASLAQNDKVLVYNSTLGKFTTRARNNQLANLVDVSLSTAPNYVQILQRDVDGLWKNMDLSILRDPNPVLGSNLDANGKYIKGLSYRINTLTCSVSSHTIDYSNGDYWIIQGVSSGVLSTCIINPTFNIVGTNSSGIMLLEIRQNTGTILIGGLTNIKYEDGKPIQLSGNGKTDIITINYQNNNGVITTYVTSSALNLATSGSGGNPSYRYDKNRYPNIEFFNNPNKYDYYYRYVQLLLNFEPQPRKGRAWSDDKSKYNHTVATSGVSPTLISTYTYGIQEQVGYFSSDSSTITVTTASDIVLDGDYTIEFYVNFINDNDYMFSSSRTWHFLSGNLSIVYSGTQDNTTLVITFGSRTYSVNNANRLFRYQNNRYIHIALVRIGTTISLYIDGIICNFTGSNSDSPKTTITITGGSNVINMTDNLNSYRISKVGRYSGDFLIPAMRFGLLGGAENILEPQIKDYWGSDIRPEGTSLFTNSYIAREMFSS